MTAMRSKMIGTAMAPGTTHDDIVLPFDNVDLLPLFYLILALDTTPGEQKYEDNRRLLADIVLSCAQILHPEHDFADVENKLTVSIDDFNGYLLELAQTGAVSTGRRYGKALFPDYAQDPESMRVINLFAVLYFLQNEFEEKEECTGSAAHYAQLLLFIWGILQNDNRVDMLKNQDFRRCFKNAMGQVNGTLALRSAKAQ